MPIWNVLLSKIILHLYFNRLSKCNKRKVFGIRFSHLPFIGNDGIWWRSSHFTVEMLNAVYFSLSLTLIAFAFGFRFRYCKSIEACECKVVCMWIPSLGIMRWCGKLNKCWCHCIEGRYPEICEERYSSLIVVICEIPNIQIKSHT